MTMTQLGDYNWSLLQRAGKTFGTLNPDEALGYIEEQLYEHESEQIRDFMQWVHDNDIKIGHGNYEQRFSEFLQACGDIAEGQLSGGEFVGASGNCCPYCKVELAEQGGNVVLAGVSVLVSKYCFGGKGCGRSWFNKYSLTGYQEKDIPG